MSREKMDGMSMPAAKPEPRPSYFHAQPGQVDERADDTRRAQSSPPLVGCRFSSPIASSESLAQDVATAPTDYVNGGIPHRHAASAVSPGPQTPPGAEPWNSNSNQAPTLSAPASGDGRADGASRGRRSVQFVREDSALSAQSRQDHEDASARSRGDRFVSKLKSLAGPSQTTRSPGTSEHALSSTHSSPVANRSRRVPETLAEGGSDADADVETGDEEEGEHATRSARKAATGRKRMRRRLKNLSIPSAPKLHGGLDLGTQASVVSNGVARRPALRDSSEQLGGLSEGEGRDRLAGSKRGGAFGRGKSWMAHKGPGRPGHETGDTAESPHPRTPAHRRRISEIFTGPSGGVSDGEALASAPKRPFFGSGDRSNTFGVTRLRQMTQAFKILKKRKIDRKDLQKSAELMAELRAVTPAVMMLASMLQRDEHGNKRIPVLLEQVNIGIVNSQPDESEKEKDHSERHSLFTIDLEYGSGPSRMRWTIIRSIREILNLHYKYKLSLNGNDYIQTTSTTRKRPKQPHFPWSAFPYLRGMRGQDDTDEEEAAQPARGLDEGTAEGTAGEMTAPEGTASEAERASAALANARRRRSRMGLLGVRRPSSGLVEVTEGSSTMDGAVVRKKFVEKQREMLEKYLRAMIHWLMFRADSNRLCRFLELSALGVRLAAEGSYHGKECFLHIQSAAGIDFRRVLTPRKVIERHSRKWFLVRQNYIVVVESPSTMNIYDVYLVDPSFRIVSKGNKLQQLGAKAIGDTDKKKAKARAKGKGKGRAEADSDKDSLEDEEASGKHHTLKIYTSERKIKLFSRNQHVISQFEQSVTEMVKQTKWHEQHRFGSFAPVRENVFAQWLVDGRDYMWNVSRAISMAQDVIYIHDWWLSPELYMRRPAAISQKWRLDRLLQKKAREGVKVFVIIYRNVEQAIPIDSEYTKFSLLHLHENIVVQRSPNQLKKNQFFYAHHEKMCIVDHDIAFLGGIDLCFGRWDTPKHPLTDDRPTGFEPGSDAPKDADHCQLWPGKDYSNPRVLDFFKLNEPYEEMYDRSKVPRMPWHDVSMQVVGQPARDLTRHFVQRWNYLRRERKPTRPTPFLLPPPDANTADLESVGLTGSCQVQMLRSAGDWSLGLPKEVSEHSIQNAYISLIEDSEHFVYMENQFFISSTETLNTKVHNRIGDALVDRIMRAHEAAEKWRCCVMIPLMPGFQNTVAQDSGSSVRLIMQFQYRSICRGPNSIFGRLQKANIEPEDYIQFFSLRQWGKLGNNQLVTEQLYIHAKTLIVDDRVVLIGSANINERSMLGNRDSECAAVVKDGDMMDSIMAGEPYLVGRFAHTLRMRLMREHLGLDVDDIADVEREASESQHFEADMDRIYSDNVARASSSHSSPRTLGRDGHASEEKGQDQVEDAVVSGGREVLPSHLVVAKPALVARLKDSTEDGSHSSSPSSSTNRAMDTDSGRGNAALPPPDFTRRTTTEMGLKHTTLLPDLPLTDDTDIGGPGVRVDEAGKATNEPIINPLAADIHPAHVSKDCMRDPLSPEFWDNVWNRCAANNTKLYRRVFRCMPDSEVVNWDEYKECEDYSMRFQGYKKADEPESKSPAGSGGGGAAVGVAAPSDARDAMALSDKMRPKGPANTTCPKVTVSSGDGVTDEKASRPPSSLPSSQSEKNAARSGLASPAPSEFPAYDGHLDAQLLDPAHAGPSPPPLAADHGQRAQDRRTTFSSTEKPSSSQGDGARSDRSNTYGAPQDANRRRRRGTTRGSGRRGSIFPYELVGRDQAEELCKLMQGHIVQFPYDWLENEENESHWLYQADLLAPKEIYD